MPRERRSEQKVVIPTNSLVASAVRYPGKVSRTIYNPVEQWQRDCYRHYAICGEARAAARFYGHNLARATLHVEQMTATGPQKKTTGAAAALLDDLFSGKEGQAQMLEALGVHLVIAGECYLVGRSLVTAEQSGAQEDEHDVWEIVSVVEMDVSGETWKIRYQEDRTPVELTDDDVIIRIWVPDPARRMKADSPFKSLLPILTEIEWSTRHIFQQLSSRLAGAGILFMPQEMSFPPPPPVNGKEKEYANNATAFMMTLADAMLAPIENADDPSALVPIVVTAPEQLIDKAKLLHFWSNLDEKALEMRNDAIHRFALGMDMPAEQVEGMSSNNGTGGGRSNGVSHWGAWQIEEATIKLHIEPMLTLICNALTIGYLRPLLGDNFDTRLRVGFNTAALRLRPDRSKEAFTLYSIGAINKEALLRENGFDSDDEMDDEEFKFWLLTKVSTGSATPEMVASALKQLGVEVEVGQLAGLAPPSTPPQLPPVPTTEGWPEEPRTPEEREAANLLPAAEALVYRALERTGNRIRQHFDIRPPGVPARDIHTLVQINGNADDFLKDAWSCAPMVLEGVVEDPEATIQTLNAYVRALLVEQSPHSRHRLQQWLEVGALV